MANRQRDSAKEAFWRGVFERCAASGLSVRAFCEREGLNKASFYSWRRTIAERDGTACPLRLSFVPAVVADGSESDAFVAPEEAQCRTSIAIELTGGCVLRLSGPNATEQLADLVIALQLRGRR